MKYKPFMQCRYPGCRNLAPVGRGYCIEHKEWTLGSTSEEAEDAVNASMAHAVAWALEGSVIEGGRTDDG